ncbi:MAG: hypothetical protein M1376_16520 [Planctomycetes bacterium]|nr:hypothetical protein [Planctomycetota bacterium]
MKTEARTVRGKSTKAEALADTPRPVLVKGLSRLATFICGKEILILGPGNAGKTKFAQYLQRAALDPEGKREMTYAVTRSPAFVVGLGGENGLVLRVRRAVDTPGQVGPLQHAILIARRKPHAVIVILDCSSDPLATLRWFCLFCNALDSVLRKVAPVAHRLQEMVVLLNKRDKIEDKEFAKLHQAVRKVLARFLTVAWGEERVNSISVQECILARTGRGTALIDGAIAQLTERLLKRRDPPAAATGPDPALASSADLPFDPLRPSDGLTSTPCSGPVHPAATAGSKPPIVPIAGPRPSSARSSYKPVPASSSGPAGRRDPPAAAAGSKPPIVPLAGPRPSSPRPSFKPAPTPSSPSAGRQAEPAAGADPKPVATPPASPHPSSSNPSDKPIPTRSSGPAFGAAAKPAAPGVPTDASGPKEEPKASGTSSGEVRDITAGNSGKREPSNDKQGPPGDKQDATSDKSQTPNDKGQPTSRSTFRSRWPLGR